MSVIKINDVYHVCVKGHGVIFNGDKNDVIDYLKGIKSKTK